MHYYKQRAGDLFHLPVVFLSFHTPIIRTTNKKPTNAPCHYYKPPAPFLKLARAVYNNLSNNGKNKALANKLINKYL